MAQQKKYDEDFKKNIVALYQSGKTQTQISKEYGISMSAVSRWINHTLLRDIVPKGESFDDFTQETVNLIFSNVNSVKRKSLNGKTAFEMFSFTYGTDIAALLGMYEIPPLDVIQSPKLLKN